MSGKRYPLEPLARRLDIDLGQPGGEPVPDIDRGVSALHALMRDAGRDRHIRTIKRWRVSGVDAITADWLACHLAGVNPLDIWPDWDDDGAIEDAAH